VGNITSAPLRKEPSIPPPTKCRTTRLSDEIGSADSNARSLEQLDTFFLPFFPVACGELRNRE
jgi:hypothetical protein